MTERMASWYARTVLRHPWLTLMILLGALAAVAPAARDLRIEVSAETLLSADDSNLRAWRQVNLRYQVPDYLFLAVEATGDIVDETTLTLLTRLQAEIAAVAGVREVISVLDVPLVTLIRGPIVDVAENSRTLRQPDINLNGAREELTTSPLYRERIVSSDGRVSALQIILAPPARLLQLREARDRLLRGGGAVQLRAAENSTLAELERDYAQAQEASRAATHQTIASIRAMLPAYRSQAQLYLGGLPLVADDMRTWVVADLFKLTVMVFAVSSVLLAGLMRTARWVILPLAAAVYAQIAMVGLLGQADFGLTIVSVNCVPLMPVVAVALAMPLVAAHRTLCRTHPEEQHATLVALAVRQAFTPGLVTAGAPGIAFAALLLTDFKPAMDLGRLMLPGLGLALLANYLLLPALLVVSGRAAPTAPGAGLHARPGVAGLALATALAFAAVTGIPRLTAERSFISHFHADTEIYQGLQLVDGKLGGTLPLDLVLTFPAAADETTGETVDPDLAAAYRDAEQASDKSNTWFTPAKIDRIKAIHDYLDSQPEIGKVLSLASTLRVAERINGGTEFTAFELNLLYKRIPQSVRAAMVEPYLSIEHDEARIELRIIDTLRGLERQALLERIARELHEKFGLTPDQYALSGPFVLYTHILQSAARALPATGVASTLALLLVLALVSRSGAAALRAILPGALATLAMLGVMAWLDWPLDVMSVAGAALIMAVAAVSGLYGQASDQARAAIGSTLLMAAGLSALVCSHFIPTARCGLLTAIGLCWTLLVSLTELPRHLSWQRPRGEGEGKQRRGPGARSGR